MSYGKVLVKAPVSTRSPMLIGDESIWYSDG